MSVHRAASLALRCVLYISHTLDMPGDHCDIPPKSAWLNWAIRPPPLRRAASTTCTAAGETECLFAIRSTRSPSFADISGFLILRLGDETLQAGERTRSEPA